MFFPFSYTRGTLFRDPYTSLMIHNICIYHTFVLFLFLCHTYVFVSQPTRKHLFLLFRRFHPAFTSCDVPVWSVTHKKHRAGIILSSIASITPPLSSVPKLCLVYLGLTPAARTLFRRRCQPGRRWEKKVKKIAHRRKAKKNQQERSRYFHPNHRPHHNHPPLGVVYAKTHKWRWKMLTCGHLS